jgi:hypothetical protein
VTDQGFVAHPPEHLVPPFGPPDEWWARVCYALALLVELYRALVVDGSRLQRLDATSRADDLLRVEEHRYRI